MESNTSLRFATLFYFPMQNVYFPTQMIFLLHKVLYINM